MVRKQLNFSRSGLFGHAILSLALGGTAGLVAFEIPDEEVIRASHGLGLLFGADVVRWVVWVCAACAVVAGLALLRRLIGDRTAAAIHYDGIELRGAFLSRRMPWRSIDRIYLRAWRVNSKTRYFIRVESRCPRDGNALHHYLASRSFGVAVDLLDATEAEAAAWVAEADSAWRSVFRPPPRIAPLRQDFGTRAA